MSTIFKGRETYEVSYTDNECMLADKVVRAPTNFSLTKRSKFFTVTMARGLYSDIGPQCTISCDTNILFQVANKCTSREEAVNHVITLNQLGDYINPNIYQESRGKI